MKITKLPFFQSITWLSPLHRNAGISYNRDWIEGFGFEQRKDFLSEIEFLLKAWFKNSIDFYFLQEYPLEDETLARTFYAVVSALIQSADVDHACLFVRDMLIVVLAEKDLLEIWCPAEPLNILNEILEREGQELVEPRLIGQTGIRTVQPVFQVGLYTNKKFISSGEKNFFELLKFLHYWNLISLSLTTKLL